MLGTANASGGFTGYNRSGLFKLLNMNVLKLFLLMGKKRMFKGCRMFRSKKYGWKLFLRS